MTEGLFAIRPLPSLIALFQVRWHLGFEGNDPCDDWDANAFLGLPEGLWYRAGEIQYECESCGEWTELPVDPAEFELGHSHNVCGRTPRCSP